MLTNSTKTRWILTLAFACAATAGLEASDSTMLVACAPGYPGGTEQAQPTMDEFAAQGHVVLGCGRTQKAVKGLQAEIGDPHEFYAVDVTSDTAVKSWASVVLAKHGPPDFLINNAGVINRNAPLWELDAREFDEVMHVNVRGVANVLRHFIPAMRERKTGDRSPQSAGIPRCRLGFPDL